ncbi:MAG: hypothetical protein J2P36_03970 [Ktedonobacteraceae bacterium]|nr:hypothetical protein [Ktedonobacteraceae bacterium]
MIQGGAISWLEGARQAPSAHNTQPWRFRELEDGRIAVSWQPERALPASDPTRRDLYLSLGTAIESAVLGAATAHITLTFGTGPSNVEDLPANVEHEQIVGYLQPVQAEVSEEDLLLARSLHTRHTARVPHLPQPVPASTLKGMQEEAQQRGSMLYVLTERHAIRKLAKLARQATAEQFADPAIQEELWHWLRLDPHDPAYRRDGLNAECMNLQGFSLAVARFAMSPVRMRWLSHVGLHHLLALETEWTVRHSTSLCLLTTPSLARQDVIQAGRTLLRLWLMADQAGLTTHPVSALIDSQSTVVPTLAVFGAQGAMPAAIFRLGVTQPVARSHRLPREELVLEASRASEQEIGRDAQSKEKSG